MSEVTRADMERYYDSTGNPLKAAVRAPLDPHELDTQAQRFAGVGQWVEQRHPPERLIALTVPWLAMVVGGGAWNGSRVVLQPATYRVLDCGYDRFIVASLSHPQVALVHAL